MTVYVDALQDWGWRLGRSSHLLPNDSSPAAIEELHRFATRIGVKRKWFQNKRWPHYDLTATKHLAAVRAGAVRIDTRTWLRWQRVGSSVPHVAQSVVTDILSAQQTAQGEGQ